MGPLVKRDEFYVYYIKNFRAKINLSRSSQEKIDLIALGKEKLVSISNFQNYIMGKNWLQVKFYRNLLQRDF